MEHSFLRLLRQEVVERLQQQKRVIVTVFPSLQLDWLICTTNKQQQMYKKVFKYWLNVLPSWLRNTDSQTLLSKQWNKVQNKETNKVSLVVVQLYCEGCGFNS